MKIFSIFVMTLLFHSCSLFDTDSPKDFSIKTEKTSYIIDSTTIIVTTFTNNLDNEVKIYNSSCGGPSFVVEKNNDQNWNLFGGQPVCDRIPDEPIKLTDGKQIELTVRISLNSPFDTGLYRMKFEIKYSNNGVLLEDKYLYSNQFEFIQ